eukprot:Skav202768  [mRNA]  locus=scaffold326:249916:252197:+ [translate_table: standard]
MWATLNRSQGGTGWYADVCRVMADLRLAQLTAVLVELQEAFSVFDRDKSGQVTASELKHVMNSLGEKVTNEEVEQMIAEADMDGDGELSVEDFIQFVQLKSLNSRQ